MARATQKPALTAQMAMLSFYARVRDPSLAETYIMMVTVDGGDPGRDELPINRGMTAKVKRGPECFAACEASDCMPTIPCTICKVHPAGALGMPTFMITALVHVRKRAPAEHAYVPIPVLRSFRDGMGMAVRCSTMTRDEQDLPLIP